MITHDTIFIDMDGVLSDFIGGASKILGHDPAQVLKDWPRGEFHGFKVFGLVSEENFWSTIDGKLGPKVEDFWASLELCERGKDLFDLCEDHAPTYVLTSPSRNASSSSGKVKWLQRHFGARFRSFIFTQHKHLLARRGRILVDDWDKNIEKWEENAGTGILVPRVWNQAHRDTDRSFMVVAEQLKEKFTKPFNI